MFRLVYVKSARFERNNYIPMIESYFYGGAFSYIFVSNCFCSQKRLSYARAYIDFKRPEDVIEFAEYFDGHVFVNKKGSPRQYTKKR